MTWAHLHLALNHVPVIGILIGLLLLGFGIFRGSRELTRSSFWLLAGLAVITVFVYLTGEPVEEMVEGLPGISERVVEQHEEAALVASVATVILGVAAAIGLLLGRGGRRDPRRYSIVILVLALVASVLLGWTANLGGQIRHPEIRSVTGAPVGTGESSSDKDPQDTKEDQN